jgi:hypothetical protein
VRRRTGRALSPEDGHASGGRTDVGQRVAGDARLLTTGVAHRRTAACALVSRSRTPFGRPCLSLDDAACLQLELAGAVSLTNVALRHQLAVLQRSGGRPRLRRRDCNLLGRPLTARGELAREPDLRPPATVVAWHRHAHPPHRPREPNLGPAPAPSGTPVPRLRGRWAHRCRVRAAAPLAAPSST